MMSGELCAIDLILSCMLCYQPLSLISPDSNLNRLWFAECGHLFCTVHLQTADIKGKSLIPSALVRFSIPQHLSIVGKQ